jgi:hypothetical protein
MRYDPEYAQRKGAVWFGAATALIAGAWGALVAFQAGGAFVWLLAAGVVLCARGWVWERRYQRGRKRT